MSICNSSSISAVTVMKIPETLRFIPDHLKTKRMCKHALKKICLSIKICS